MAQRGEREHNICWRAPAAEPQEAGHAQAYLQGVRLTGSQNHIRLVQLGRQKLRGDSSESQEHSMEQQLKSTAAPPPAHGRGSK
mmetsp:Transcript_77135/g.136633  ORF Transcript_77135/g.136633 Transcript_77135/m.136633 type:complete len:84 (+) Transcript_77135:735-986(+)